MTDSSVVFSLRARQHLRSIERYIAKRGSPQNAAGFVRRIVERCDRIASAPLQGEPLDHLRPGLRRTGMEGIVAIHFKVESRLVTILSITYHGRRYQPNL